MLTQKCNEAFWALDGTGASVTLSFPTLPPCLVFVASARPTVPNFRVHVDRLVGAVVSKGQPVWVHA
jgi:hypothetical protein